MKKNGSWTLISDQEIYDNPWIRLNHHEVIDPSGQPGIYGKIHFKNTAIGIIPIDEDGYTWIVGQHRYPLSVYSWEIPEGGGPLGQDTLNSAKRELQEETGIIAKEWQVILDCDMSNSVTDECGIVYVATKLTFDVQSLESSEDITVKKIPFRQLYKDALDGRIRDALSLMGIFKLAILEPALIQ
ncbi:MAG: NUDIX hydrolase [Bacteroidia bacterium]|nr:NUDIX hydrolase [Bacteroidia bacterium]